MNRLYNNRLNFEELVSIGILSIFSAVVKMKWFNNQLSLVSTHFITKIVSHNTDCNTRCVLFDRD